MATFNPFNWLKGNQTPPPDNSDGKPNPAKDAFQSIINEVNDRRAQDIQEWKRAVEEAESETNPDWERISDLYQQIAEDAHVSAVIDQATEELQGTGFEIYTNNTLNEQITERLEGANWFYDCIKYILQAKFYGFSLVSISGVIEEGEPKPFFYQNRYNVRQHVGAIDLYPRRVVVPQSFGVKKFAGAGYPDMYVDDPRWKDNLMLILDTTLLGTFMAAAPYWIFKKNAMIAWAEYQQIMGIPFRVVKTSIHDKTRRDNAQRMIESSGLATGMVIDTTDEFEVISPTGAASAHQVFEQMMRYVDEQFSKLFLGQTMTTDSGSSRSQAEIHSETKAAKFAGYRKFVETQINENLIPRLIALKILPSGKHRFKFTDIPEQRDFVEKVDAVKKLTDAGYTFDTKYLNQFIDMEVGEVNRSYPTGSPLAKLRK